MKITRIVSGGQTGADRGGWEAAMYCSLPYGGWVPKDRKSEDGTIPVKYEGLQETRSADYLVRTEANIVDSDATVVFACGSPTGGSKRTVELAAKHNRPCLAVDLDQPRDKVVGQISEWMQSLEPAEGVLNVAGSRESKAPGIQDQVMAVMIEVISKVNGKLFYPLPESKPMILRDQK